MNNKETVNEMIARLDRKLESIFKISKNIENINNNISYINHKLKCLEN